MPTSAAGNRRSPRRAGRGFTLIELLVVVAIVAIASVAVTLALRDTPSAQLEREAQRLAAHLESARARSRASGVAVRWRPVDGGFAFEGLGPQPEPQRWLSAGVVVRGPAQLLLGPEPIIPAQAVALALDPAPRELRVATDGLRPFAVSQPLP